MRIVRVRGHAHLIDAIAWSVGGARLGQARYSKATHLALEVIVGESPSIRNRPSTRRVNVDPRGVNSGRCARGCSWRLPGCGRFALSLVRPLLTGRRLLTANADGVGAHLVRVGVRVGG